MTKNASRDGHPISRERPGVFRRLHRQSDGRANAIDDPFPDLTMWQLGWAFPDGANTRPLVFQSVVINDNKRFVDRVFGSVYRRLVRPVLPKGPAVYKAGIPTYLNHSVGDRYVPASWLPKVVKDDSGYEGALVEGLRGAVKEGDEVVVVGGGIGVTATTAAICCGDAGSVLCFEAAAKGVRRVVATAERNRVQSRLQVEHAIVCQALHAYSDTGGCPVIAAAKLPACDVLQLDCEGAELFILQDILIRPRVILVETHGLYGAPTASCEAILMEKGYRVRNLGVAEVSLSQFCLENDVMVLLGERD